MAKSLLGHQYELSKPSLQMHQVGIAPVPAFPATPAATTYAPLGLPLDAIYLDNRGRPLRIMDGPGQPLRDRL